MAAVAGVAVVDAMWGGGGRADERPVTGETRLRGPDVPAAEALRGRLYFTGSEGCRLGTVDLTDLSLAPSGLHTTCAMWISSGGNWAAVGRHPQPENRSEVWLARLGDRARFVRRFGVVVGDVSWAPRGDRAAWCGEDGRTTVVEVRTGRTRTLPGCAPRFGASGSVYTIADGSGARVVYADGVPRLDEADLRRAFEHRPSGAVHPIGVDERADGLLAVVASAAPRDIVDLLEEQGIDADSRQPGEIRRALGLTGPYGAMALAGGGSLPQIELELWRDGVLEASLRLGAAAYPFANRRFGELVRFSPDGSELALGYTGAGVPVMLIDVDSLQTRLRPTVQHGFAWSPDGAFFALSTGREITIAGALRSQPAYVLPLETSSLDWRR